MKKISIKNLKIIAYLMMISWMGIIFLFSNQAGLSSNKISYIISEKATEKVADKNEISVRKRIAIKERFNTFFRKSAHFFLYLILGILACFLLRTYHFNIMKILIFSLIISLIYAISDEIHQIFVPGRTAQFSDILTDFIGAFIGSGVFAIIYLVRKIMKKHASS